MKKPLLTLAIAALLPVLSQAAAAIDPCVNAHEKMGDLRRVVVTEQRVQDGANKAALPTAEFERVWFAAQEPKIRKWFDENEAAKVRAVSGNVDTAFAMSFTQWKQDAAVRAEMTRQYRVLRQQYLHSSNDAAVSSAQREVNDSCPMDVGSQALRVGLGTVLLPVTVISGNIDAARNESGVVAQVFRGAIGISFKDIEKHGPLGGPNSFFRCPFGGC